jgi:hypothetical protein
MSVAPSLHILSRATDTGYHWSAISVIGFVGVASVLLFLVRMGVVSLPRVPLRTRKRLGQALFGVLITLAVLPAVLPYDHILARGASSGAGPATAHAKHCHVASASCADAPVASGPGQFIFTEQLLSDLGSRWTPLADTSAAALSEFSATPSTPPPRSA